MKFRFLIAVGILGVSANAISSELDVNDARISLKNYGLANCISNQFKGDSDIKSDLGLAIGAYSAMGKGQHAISQNEDTLEISHDPYAETEKYMREAYAKHSSVSKQSGKKIVFYSCLEIYNSPAFDSFIKSQDPYVSD
ncbi:hypothetical protein HU765_07545 [Pseudomonas sp. SWRI81]|uniref:hypothetical protein n=1 Tax=Pseudomonas sp. SWRI81 TaxID=2745505 RepID=UPI00164440CA|nr:hypothetical protein [Pseudomonas sp. SWRI81]MBC3269774.1 hypothetical protein [Pseudomonas sp. SWRI81]